MPLNVRRFCTAVFVNLLVFVFVVLAQDVPTAPTSGDVMRDRISKAKAFIVVRNYNAAIYELENIRKETADPAVQGVVNVLLMNSYLEQGDYKRGQELLNEFYAQQKTTRANASANYMAVASQAVTGSSVLATASLIFFSNSSQSSMLSSSSWRTISRPWPSLLSA